MHHLSNSDWRALFVDNRLGKEVLEILSTLYYDRLSYDQQNQYNTAYNEGQKSVVMFILRKCAQIPEEPEEPEGE